MMTSLVMSDDLSYFTQEKGGERESDGAFSPRDHHHGEGEDHNNAFDHEAILGSRKEAEEFDELEPEEAKRRLGILLTKMDRDNDEAIDRLVILVLTSSRFWNI